MKEVLIYRTVLWIFGTYPIIPTFKPHIRKVISVNPALTHLCEVLYHNYNVFGIIITICFQD